MPKVKEKTKHISKDAAEAPAKDKKRKVSKKRTKDKKRKVSKKRTKDKKKATSKIICEKSIFINAVLSVCF